MVRSGTALICALLLLAGCGGKKRVGTIPPAPPPPVMQTPAESSPAEPKQPPQPAEEAGEEIPVPPGSEPILVETGIASWYGPPYHNRRASNGEVFNMHAPTAAHRTLPLGSIVRVTNVKSGKSTLVRINDRGPFVDGRIIDLSLAAAKKIDVWRAGLAEVKLEVLQTPVPLETGGRWCVQIGAFATEDGAAKLQDRLQRRYATAQVLKFASPVGDWWVRVRVLKDDRARAEEVARENPTEEGSVFLVRLD